ncbi:DUF63 family protein, partial [Candidatus Micrarchaeota archaeon]|nr:DUF63 family protein [Candidatus Micrarchaeota archaeon]
MNYEGYNLVNTLVYAGIALAVLYILYTAFKKYRIKINEQFAYGVLSFILLGSTVRVITDSIDSGVFTAATPIHKMILESGIYDYGFLT